jgi:L-asparaginase II
MPTSPYQPLFELTRGQTVESIHFGALAVSDPQGRLVAWHGDPQVYTFLRSTAKPFQALPFIERGGQSAFQLLPSEVALICASHSGTDEQVIALRQLQSKVRIGEADLACGVHPSYHEPTAQAMRQRGEEPTPNRHNCSGKHTGMLAYARMQNWPIFDYLNTEHPVQQSILQAFAEICGLDPEQVALGIDGCSAPNFAVPLSHAARAYARLCDPAGLPPARAEACRAITAAMTQNPEMVAGPGRFDTRLMETTGGRIVAKGGAEGYQGLGLLPGAAGPGMPALGIAIKISDGDPQGRARAAVSLEVLRQLGALSATALEALAEFGPSFPVLNWRRIVVGEARSVFRLQVAG